MVGAWVVTGDSKDGFYVCSAIAPAVESAGSARRRRFTCLRVSTLILGFCTTPSSGLALFRTVSALRMTDAMHRYLSVG